VTLALYPTNQIPYNFGEDSNFQVSQSEPLAIATRIAAHPNYLAEQSSTSTNAVPFASVDKMESESKEKSKYSGQSLTTSNTLRSLMEFLFNQYLSHNSLRVLEHFPVARPRINSEYGCVRGAVSSSRGQCSLHISTILLAYFHRWLSFHALYTVRFFLCFFRF